jgi:ferredoxin
MGISRAGTGALEGQDRKEVELERISPPRVGELKNVLFQRMGFVMVLNIDYSLCQGCGGCSDAYPTLFKFRDEKAWVMNSGAFSEEDRAGILSICPYYAISIPDEVTSTMKRHGHAASCG